MFLIEEALIMEIGKTANNLIITKEMVLNSINSFNLVPIVYNKNQEFKNYTGDNFNNYYKNETIIGFIKENGNIIVTEKEVFADILIMDNYKHLWKNKYDNWCIELTNDKTAFKLISIEVF